MEQALLGGNINNIMGPLTTDKGGPCYKPWETLGNYTRCGAPHFFLRRKSEEFSRVVGPRP